MAERTIGFIQPSSAPFQYAYARASALMQRLGWSVVCLQASMQPDRFLAGSDVQRARELMDQLQNTQLDALMALAAGAGSIRLLPHLDWDAVRLASKPVIGFSDTTALQAALWQRAQVVSYSGFHAGYIQENGHIGRRTEASLQACLLKNAYEVKGGVPVCSGVVKAPLVCGTLKLLLSLVGTSYEVDMAGKILVLEDVYLEPHALDRMFMQLNLMGVLDTAAGLVLGAFSQHETLLHPERDGAVTDVLNEWCARIHIPCIRDFPYGHIENRAVLPFGGMATLDADACCLHVERRDFVR